MKGTAPRGENPIEDRKNRIWLARNKKIKAENIMIVDLLRNDLGRISDKVWVSKLFNIEKYRTLYQLTSTIESKLKKNIKMRDIFSSLFPCGSVTGAPKIKTMEIIKGLEREPRGVYTGAIGYIKKGHACFNVAIRTVSLKGSNAEMGIGGGILYDSLEKTEFEEALLKSKFLTEKLPEFSLIESILWQEEKGFFLLGLHLNRLKRSCEYFSIPFNLRSIKEELGGLEKDLNGKIFKVKIVVYMDGQINLEKEALEPVTTPVKTKISSLEIDPNNIFLYHKTSQRTLYERERKEAQKQGFFEAIFFNTENQLTEGTITNIFLLKKGYLYTPFVRCGLLGGVLRKKLLQEGKTREAVLYLKDLLEADKVYIGNSVRGLLEAEVSLPTETENIPFDTASSLITTKTH
jgi:para-aminobenzoate synthetase/4-amino-4-deoxychorismate lyase